MTKSQCRAKLRVSPRRGQAGFTMINVEKAFAADGMLWDKGTSPIFADGKLVIAAMQEKSMSYLAAVDKSTGRKVWLTERKTDAVGETCDAYTTPFVATLKGVETIVTWGADYLTGHDAKTGKELWRCGGFNPKKNKVWRNIASATFSGDVAIVPFGREELIAGIRMGGSGDITKPSSRVTFAKSPPRFLRPRVLA